jgi:hypothetical protein
MHWLPEIDGIQYLADLGLPDPNKGEGGKDLIVPDRYEGEIDNAFAACCYFSRTRWGSAGTAQITPPLPPDPTAMSNAAG